MRQAGKVKTLAVLSAEPLEAYPDVPTIGEATGEPWSGGPWRGIVGTAGLPDDIRQTLTSAVETAWQSEEFQEFIQSPGFSTHCSAGEQSRQLDRKIAGSGTSVALR